MATPNSILMNDRWKSTKQAHLISMNTSKHTNPYFTNKISFENLKGKTFLLILKRSNEQFETRVRNNQTISTICPMYDTIVHYNSQHSSKISEATSTDHLNISVNGSNTSQSLQVQTALSRQAIRSLPNILRSRSVKLKYKEENLENSRDYQYEVSENLQYNCDLKHTCRKTHQTIAAEGKKVYSKKSLNKRKQVHKPFSIKQESPKLISENERSEETEFKEDERSGGTELKDILYNEDFKEINVTTIASYDENKLRIHKVKTDQADIADQSLDCRLKSEMCIEQEFCSSTSMIDQGNIENHEYQCTPNQNEITGIQSELCIPNYTDFLGIGNYFAASDEVHKLLHPTLDDYIDNADSTNNDTNDLDLLIRNDCAQQHIETVRKLLPESIIINNDICEQEEANNIMNSVDSFIENTVLFENIKLPTKSKVQNESQFVCNNNVQYIGDLNVHENLDSVVTTYKTQDDDVLDLTYALVSNNMTVQETADNLVNKSLLSLNHKNSHKKKTNKMTDKITSKEKSEKNKCGNTATYSLTNYTEQLDDGYSHEFKTHGIYYTEENPFINHLNFSTNFRTTYTSVSCKKMYKRRPYKIKHIKTLHDATILPKEPPPSLRCNKCSKIYSKLGSLKKHMELHENFRLTCKQCSKTFREKVDFTRHVDRKCRNTNTL